MSGDLRGKVSDSEGKERVVQHPGLWNGKCTTRGTVGQYMRHCLLWVGAGNSSLCTRNWLVSAKAMRRTRRYTKVSAQEDPEWAGGVCVSKFPTSTSNIWPHSLIPNYGKEGGSWGPKRSLCLNRSGGSCSPQPGDSGALPRGSWSWRLPHGQQRVYLNLLLPTAVNFSPKFAFQHLGEHQNHLGSF